VILLAVSDEETGGVLGAQWMMQHHWAELDPEYVLDEGGIGSPDLFAPGKLVFGISVAEKKRMWLTLRVEGVAGHGSQPHDQNPNDRLVRALAASRRTAAERRCRRAQHDEAAHRTVYSTGS
jgi:acetylornithine deacetylase/succinyl-diaminopimelate desuccinylase-like protein